MVSSTLLHQSVIWVVRHHLFFYNRMVLISSISTYLPLFRIPLMESWKLTRVLVEFNFSRCKVQLRRILPGRFHHRRLTSARSPRESNAVMLPE